MKFVAILSLLIVASAADSSPDIQPIPDGISGEGKTTRYWDCCAPSCAYYGYVTTQNGIPDQTCQIDGETPSTKENNSNSGCVEGGTAYTCSVQQPFVINSTLAYGWTAASFTGGVDTSKCCHCLLLSFKDQLAGKQMLVQIVNTGSDLGENQFDLQIPGGGVGIFNLGCMTQWNTGEDGWGRRYGGVSTIEECDTLPEVLQPGCRFRFEYLEGVDNPLVSFIEVKCPTELVDVSKCGDL